MSTPIPQGSQHRRVTIHGAVRLPGRPQRWVLALLLAGLASWVRALPVGGTVVAGSATITQPTSTFLSVNQSSQQAAINWATFNVGAGESVRFNQPSSSAVTLNTVLGGSMSTLAGNISANGHILLINPSGVLFAQGAQVDAAGLIASSLALNQADFLAGNYIFQGSGVGAAVTNQGVLQAHGGPVLLLGSQVSNSGTIVADGSTVQLVAGSRVTLDRFGDGLINLSVDAGALNAAINNAGTLQADGGTVALVARTQDLAQQSVINTSGMVRANTLSNVDGHIVLDAGPGGASVVSGTLDAMGTQPGQRGGSVQVLGDRVTVQAGGRIDVSGDAGGGTVNVGGNAGGQGPLQNATQTTMDGTVVADATGTGSGGGVVVWSEGQTQFNGSISARGGAHGGNGGSVEVSGAQLAMGAAAQVDAGAPLGQGGNWLIDPYDYTINSTQAATIVGTLNTGTNVTVNANIQNTGLGAGGSTGAGNITLNSDIVKTQGGAATLTLNATANIFVDANITSTSNALSVTLNAPSGTVTGNGNFALNGGVLTFNTGNDGAYWGGVTGTGSLVKQGAGNLFMLAGADAVILISSNNGVDPSPSLVGGQYAILEIYNGAYYSPITLPATATTGAILAV